MSAPWLQVRSLPIRQALEAAVVLTALALWGAFGLGVTALSSPALLCVGLWLSGWVLNIWLTRFGGQVASFGVPIVFGLTLFAVWEALVRLYEIPSIILPPPLAIWDQIKVSYALLWADFLQTVVFGALTGYVIGCCAGVALAIIADRWDFLRRGLLPVGTLLAALPIVGTAPIFVMWFGFGPASKAAVVVAMVVFPIMINMIQGLVSVDPILRDLMHSYGATRWRLLWSLKLPAAVPHLFTGLKLATTLALIGAIVAEFFGSPTVGIGFRIKIELGRLAMDMVWAEIFVAMAAGLGFYGIISALERSLAFWHPSHRGASTAR